MGKGDKRTKRGKICRGTFGKTRPRGKKKAQKQASPTVGEVPAKPAKA